MHGALSTHGRSGGLLLHQRTNRRVLTFKAARTMTVSSARNGSAANGAGHAADGPYYGVLKFPRTDAFRTVLSVDGGGLRGLVPAGMLEGVEDMIKEVAIRRELVGTRTEDGKVLSFRVTKPEEFSVLLADYFDVAAGTSTGAIVATYVASKGSQAASLHAKAGFREGLCAAQNVKARVHDLDMPEAAKNAIDPPPGSVAAVQALFLSSCEEIFPGRSWFNMAMAVFRPKYPAHYRHRFVGEKMGVEHVLQSAFSEHKHMSEPGVLATSLVVTSYDLNNDRPFIFWASKKKGESGYAALRRTLAGAKEDETADIGDRGQSDLVRQPQNFKLWEVVRASTAAPTFFPTAKVHMLDRDPKTKLLQMTDGGVVANNPSMVGLTFAAGEYKTKFVAVESDKPSLAVLSLGCGTTSELNNVGEHAGAFGWAVKGPIVDILQGGAGELSAAIFQELTREWPGSKECQFLRVQLTAGYDENKYETLSYSKYVVTLPSDNRNPQNDVRVGRFQRALHANGYQLKANNVLKTMDVVKQKEQLLGLGCAVVADEHIKNKLRKFVEEFVLAPESKPEGATASKGAAKVMSTA